MTFAVLIAIVGVMIITVFGSVVIVNENNETITHIDIYPTATVYQLFDLITQKLIDHHNYSQLCQFEFLHSGLIFSELTGYSGETTQLFQISIYPDFEPIITVKASNNVPLIMNECEFKRQSQTGWEPLDQIITTIVYANNIEIEFYFHIKVPNIPNILDILNIDNHIADAIGHETRKSLRIAYYYNVFQITRTMNIKTGIEGLKPENYRIDITEIPLQYLSLTNHVYIKFTNYKKIIVVNDYKFEQEGDFRIFGQNRVCSVYHGLSRLSSHNSDNELLFDELEMEEQQQQTPVTFKYFCLNTNVNEFEFIDDESTAKLVQRMVKSEQKRRGKCCLVS